jgi:hypothetical protein
VRLDGQHVADRDVVEPEPVELVVLDAQPERAARIAAGSFSIETSFMAVSYPT